MKIVTAYDIGDQVTIDRDSSLVGVIIGVIVEGIALNIQYKISWFSNGNCNNIWIEEWRLNRWEG